jgi:hypothetical protein
MAYPDFEEFIGALNARDVRYLLIGAHAVAFHARPRATKDLDVYVDPTRANAKRLKAALGDFFGGSPPGYADSDLLDPDSGDGLRMQSWRPAVSGDLDVFRHWRDR